MKNQINNVCLSFQCPMKWTSMQALTNTERFCSQCHLSVTDFTNATQQELAEKLAISQGRVCGRFNKSQMSADYLKRMAAAVAMTSAMACTQEIIVKPLERTSSIENVVAEEEFLMGDVMYLPDSVEELTLTGVIFTTEEDSVHIN